MEGQKKAEEKQRNSNYCSAQAYTRGALHKAGYCTPLPSKGAQSRVGYLTPSRGKTSENIRIGHRGLSGQSSQNPCCVNSPGIC
ncbi:hypothetical protein NPIL_513231 [Nephila pilipes]|uniref:Uncharacterized protein n=1 Tax=Nephila pilipes TaxID=299642 RepID=A0A8X6TF01_NEPPI|nr:hypothetical protein NPIL_513231 [Nephila pilipes]